MLLWLLALFLLTFFVDYMLSFASFCRQFFLLNDVSVSEITAMKRVLCLREVSLGNCLFNFTAHTSCSYTWSHFTHTKPFK